MLQISCSTSAFFFYPSKEIKYSPDTTLCKYEEVNFKSKNDSILNGWFIKPNSGKIIGTVLFFHGNGGNIGYQFQALQKLAGAGFQSLVFDYEGYGNSRGKPSQENVLSDGLAALEYIRGREDVKGTKLILFGQSLGGHLAVVVAAQKQELIHAIIIEGAFTSHDDIAAYTGKRYASPGFFSRLIIPSKYDAIKVIEKIKIPKLIIHSTEDKTCPYFMGKKLFDKAIAPKEFWEIKGRHIYCSKLYKEEFIARFLKMIETTK